jgi:hypothetical protein
VAFLNHFLTVGRHGVNVCRKNITIRQFPLPPPFLLGYLYRSVLSFFIETSVGSLCRMILGTDTQGDGKILVTGCLFLCSSCVYDEGRSPSLFLSFSSQQSIQQPYLRPTACGVLIDVCRRIKQCAELKHLRRRFSHIAPIAGRGDPSLFKMTIRVHTKLQNG